MYAKFIPERSQANKNSDKRRDGGAEKILPTHSFNLY